MDGHFSVGHRAVRDGDAIGSTLSTLPSPCEGAPSAAGGGAGRGREHCRRGRMPPLPSTERKRASESIRNWPLATTWSPSAQARDDFDVVAQVRAQRHVAWLERTVGLAHDDDGTLAGANDGFRRHDQRVLQAPVTCSRSSMPGTSLPPLLSTSKRAFRVRVFALTSGRISELAVERLRRIGLKSRLDLLAARQAHGLRFRYLGHRPDLFQAGDAEQRHAGRDRHALSHAQLGHDAIGRRAARSAPVPCRFLLAAPDELVRDRHGPHAVARRGNEVFETPERCRASSSFCGPASRARRPWPGPGPCAHAPSARAPTGVRHSRPRASAPRQRAARRTARRRPRRRMRRFPRVARSRADAQVLLDRGADLHAPPSGPPCRSVGVHRHQLHVHERRLAGLVEALARNHRVVPVEDLAALGGRPGAVRPSMRPRASLSCGPGRRRPWRAARRPAARADRVCSVHCATSAVSGRKASWIWVLARSRCSVSSLRWLRLRHAAPRTGGKAALVGAVGRRRGSRSLSGGNDDTGAVAVDALLQALRIAATTTGTRQSRPASPRPDRLRPCRPAPAWRRCPGPAVRRVRRAAGCSRPPTPCRNSRCAGRRPPPRSSWACGWTR
jgi:hypothetical protein